MKFLRYAAIGVVNTGAHWLVFALLLRLGQSQAVGNTAGFCVAVTFSFFANAKLTFKERPTLGRYVAYSTFMAVMSYLFGLIADKNTLHPLLTLTSFSAFSLAAGFLFADRVVFRPAK